MSKKTTLFRSEERMDLPGVVNFLRQLADRLEDKQVTLQQGAESITLKVPHNVLLEVKAVEKDKKGRVQRDLEIEIEWVEGEEATGVTLG